MPEIKKLQTVTGVTIVAPADLTSTSSTIRIAEYASDAAYVSANGVAAAGSVYISSASGVRTLRYYTGSSWRNLVPANDPADPTKVFYVDITGNTTGKFAKILFACTDNRTYTFQDETGTVPVLPIVLTSEVSGVLPTANGGTGQNSTATFPTSGAVAVVPSSGVVKSNGTVLSSSNVNLASEVTGTLPIANGGTGQTTAQTARNALLPTQTGNAGKFLKTDGTDVSWDTAGTGGAASSPMDAMNYGFTASVAASALTIALKNAAGSDASVGDPITISMRNATLATGTYNSRSVTGALSIVVTSGATLGHANSIASPIFVYALDNSGTIELAVSTTRFDDNFIGSTTVMNSSSDAANVIYSTTARSNVPMRLIGKLVSTQTTAGTWASAPSEIKLLPIEQNPIGARVVRSAQQGVAALATVNFTGTSNIWSNTDALAYDRNGLFVTGTGTDGGKFIVPISGRWSIKSSINFANLNITTSFYVALRIIVNGTKAAEQLHWNPVSSNYAPTPQVDATLNLAAGDKVHIAALNSSSTQGVTAGDGDGTNSWFQISYEGPMS